MMISEVLHVGDLIGVSASWWIETITYQTLASQTQPQVSDEADSKKVTKINAISESFESGEEVPATTKR